MLLWLLACAPEEKAPAPAEADTADTAAPEPIYGECGDPAGARTGLMIGITFAREADGASVGFDLDGVASDELDPTGCYHEDLASPEGEPGIDNAFAGLLPILELTEAAAIEGLLQDAINSGELLLLYQLSYLDDPADDACVDLALQQGVGEPYVGADGSIVSGQTFERDEESPAFAFEDLALSGGQLEAGPFTLQIPLQVFDVALLVTLNNTWIHLELGEDGAARGYMAGGLPIADIIKLVTTEENIAIGELVTALVTDAADLAPGGDGACTELSMVLEFEATSAFFFD